jgi:hypothetical protein
MYQSAADFSGWFKLQRESRKNVDFIVSTKSVILKFRFEGGLQFGSTTLVAPTEPRPVYVFFNDMVVENSSVSRTQQSMYPNKLHLKKAANPPAKTSL